MAKPAQAETTETEVEGTETEEQDEETKKADGFIRRIVQDELKKGLTDFFGELPKAQEGPKGTGKKNGILSVIFGDAE